LGYTKINKKIAKNQDVIKSFEDGMNSLKVELPDWERFKREGKGFNWSVNEKAGCSEVIIIDKTSEHVYKAKLNLFTRC
jgi:hypothetical protein